MTTKIYKHYPRIQSKQEPWVGDVVQIQENTTRGSWEIVCIMELIKSRDEEERTAKVLLPSRNTMQRSLCPFLPL